MRLQAQTVMWFSIHACFASLCWFSSESTKPLSLHSDMHHAPQIPMHGERWGEAGSSFLQ